MADKVKRGFAVVAERNPELMREIARSGAVAAGKTGKAHRWNSETAAVAGRKGGQAVARDPKHMIEMAEKSVKKRAETRAAANTEPPDEAA